MCAHRSAVDLGEHDSEDQEHDAARLSGLRSVDAHVYGVCQ